MSSPWEILGIEPTRDLRAIKRAYAAQAARLHPEEHPEEFRQLREAYEMVTDRLRHPSAWMLYPAGEPVWREAPAEEEEETPGETSQGERLVFPSGAFGKERPEREEEIPSRETAESGSTSYNFEVVERERLQYALPDFDSVFSFLETKAFSPEVPREEWQAFFENPRHRAAFRLQEFCDTVTDLLQRGELARTAWLELLLLCPQVKCREEELPCRNLRRYLMAKKYLKWQADFSRDAMERARTCYVGPDRERALQDWWEFVNSDDFLCAYSFPGFMAELTAYLRQTRELSGQCRRVVLEKYQELAYWPERWEREVYLRLVIELACYNGDRGESLERREALKRKACRGALKVLGALCTLGQWVFVAAMTVCFLWDMSRRLVSGEIFETAFLMSMMLYQLGAVFTIRYLMEKQIDTWTRNKERGMAAMLSAVWAVLLLVCFMFGLPRLDPDQWMGYFFLAVPPTFIARILRQLLKR